MGAFVGAVTSPFLRRRKGRIGKDKWIEKAAPALAGAEIKIALRNHEGIICAVNAAAAYQLSTDLAATWQTIPMLATLFLGNALPARGGAPMRPYSEFKENDIDFAQMPVTPNGTHTGFGGTLFTSTPGLKNIKSVGDVAGHPQEDLCWSTDGNCFLSVGAMSANTIKARGGYILEAPEILLIPVGAGAANGAYSCQAIDDPSDADKFYTWIVGFGNISQPLVRVRRTKPLAGGVWTFTNITNPGTGSQTRFLVDGAVIISDSHLDKLLRSTDYGKTFSLVTSLNMGTSHDLWRFGRRYFHMAESAPRIRFSSNKGLTWTTLTPGLPSGTAVPNRTVADPFGPNRYVFCRDGAANRCYIFKPFMDI
jgi:hypothetical protein